MSFPSEKEDWKRTGENNARIALNVLCSKKENIILLMFQNRTQIIRNRYSFKDS